MKLTLLLSLIVWVSACSTIAELKSTKTYTPKTQQSGAVNVVSRATGVEGNWIGHTTVVFIPVGPIQPQGDTSTNIMKSIRKALLAAGYNSKGESTFNSAEAGYLHAHVEEIKFGNFLFSTWGSITLQLTLETREGEILWERRIRSSVNAINNYDRTAKITMNRLVKDITRKLVKKDFFTATQRIKRHNDFLKEETTEVVSPRS